MKTIKEIIRREIAGEVILVPVEEVALRLHGMISLSESGDLLWQMLQKDCTREELIEAILKEYDVDEATASEDVDAFLAKMDHLGLLEH